MEDAKRDLVELPQKPIRRRRSYSPALKRQMVEETLTSDESVSEVARRHDVNANQLFRWRKLHHEGRLPRDRPEPGTSGLMPVVVSPSTEPTAPSGCIVIELGSGKRVTLRGDIDHRVLRTVLEVLR